MKLVAIQAFKMDAEQRVVVITGKGPLDIEPIGIVVPFGAMILSAAEVMQNIGASELAAMGATTSRKHTPAAASIGGHDPNNKPAS